MKRNTTQRAIVYEMVCNMHSHPSAETVYEEIKKKYPGIGRATVYRQLRDLAREGKVRCVALSVGADRFDFTLRSHSHIVCRRCGRVEDISFDDSLPVAVPPNDPVSGFLVEGCDMIYRGLCPVCQEKAEQS
ncbi:MAG: transcriptional repressor [Clostridiales bacterium]|nr:transcriptional repressor [Clostridiales bacterium]